MVIDSTDRERLSITKEELYKMLNHEVCWFTSIKFIVSQCSIPEKKNVCSGLVQICFVYSNQNVLDKCKSYLFSPFLCTCNIIYINLNTCNVHVYTILILYVRPKMLWDHNPVWFSFAVWVA